MPHQPHTDLAISFQHHWIASIGQKILWLPVESRPSCFEMNGDTLTPGNS
jgi:hypothetical protein